MATSDPIRAIEELNMEIINSIQNETKEIKIAKKIVKLKENFPFGVPRLIKDYCCIRKAKKLTSSISNYNKPEDRVYVSPPLEKNKSGVVYTCITNGYDDPIDPIYLSEGVEYILFTDKINKSNNTVWHYREIEGVNIEKKSTYTNRYYKFHPFDFFGDKDYSVYVDGNVSIVSDVSGLYSVAHEAKSGIAIHKHACRDCVYLDAKWCEYNNRGNLKAIKKQIEKYHKEGFPNHFGLTENTIIVVDLHNSIARKIMDALWEEYISSRCGRDQILLPYVMWKNGFCMSDIGSLGNDEYYNPKFRINAHLAQKKYGIGALI